MAIAGKKILRKNVARNIILEGMMEVYNTVSSTYGPRGRTVLFDRGTNAKLTKDGITVAKEIKFSNEAKNLGALLIKEAAGKSNYMSGDGSTSATILTANLCKEANILLQQGVDINDLREGFRIARDTVLERLPEYKKEVHSEKDILEIAKVSANGDEEVASFIQEAFLKIGDNGIVSIADSLSRNGKTTVNIATGLEFSRGFLTSQSVNAANDQCILKSPKVLLSNQVLNDVQELQPIVQGLQLSKTPVVIIAPDFDDEVMAWFRELLTKKTVSGSLVLAPGTSKTTIADNLLDLSVMLNGKILGDDFSINEFKDEYLGTAEQITITKGKTIIVGGEIDQKRFDEHIELLLAKINHDSSELGYSEYEIEMIKERVAKMTGGVATIYVGALTSTELGEKKDRYEDAINAVRSALKSGYVIGAGTPLLKISFGKTPEMSPPKALAYKAFMKAIRMPARKLIESAGEDPELIISEILSAKEGSGFNARTGEISYLLEDGIIDPFEVIRNTILYSSNMAESFMSIDSVIISDVPNLTFESMDEVLNEDGIKW